MLTWFVEIDITLGSPHEEWNQNGTKAAEANSTPTPWVSPTLFTSAYAPMSQMFCDIPIN